MRIDPIAACECCGELRTDETFAYCTRCAATIATAVEDAVEEMESINTELLSVLRAFRDECLRQEIKFGSLIGDADTAISRADKHYLGSLKP
jgi:hypothetical protein